ncbi:MAG: ABC transporter permease subunit [Desulfurococcales archaeon]|nr:ABC transporter permease subunit [Desulfurococcales archaeon]
MITDGKVRAIAWKEIKDLSRDYRTLISVVILPLIGLPGLALLTGALVSSQYVSIGIVVDDEKLYIGDGKALLEEVMSSIRSNVANLGIQASMSIFENIDKARGVDILVFIPKGFYTNLTSIDRTARIVISTLVGSPASDLAVRGVESAFYSLSGKVIVNRIEELASMASIEVDPYGLLNPISIQKGFHAASGAPVSKFEASVAEAAKILEFSLFFVVNPTVVFISDSIVGERERKTIERLLVAPVLRRQILAGKMIAAGFLGLISAVADGIGIMVYFMLSGISFSLSSSIILVWLLAVIGLVFSTSAIVAIVASRSSTIRAAQNASFLIVMIALSIYFAALVVDLSKLPPSISFILQLIPFTHAALMIHNYALGRLIDAMLNGAILALSWLIFLYIAARAFRSESLIMVKT